MSRVESRDRLTWNGSIMAGKEMRGRELGGGSRFIVGNSANEVGSKTGGCEEKENAQDNPTKYVQGIA